VYISCKLKVSCADDVGWTLKTYSLDWDI
jgi:hypothetical protein